MRLKRFKRWWRRKQTRFARRLTRVWRRFKEEVEETRQALRPQIHDDDAANAAFDALGGDPEREDKAFAELNTMIARSTGSIANSYTKVQIASGIVIGLVALFLTVFAEQPGANLSLLQISAGMEALAIGLSLPITTPRSTTWKHRVTTPGVYAATITPRQKYLSLSKRAFHGRVVLIRSRRISWLATWALTLPGLVLAMWAWAWLVTCVALIIIVILQRLFKRFVGNSEPYRGSLVYPSF